MIYEEINKIPPSLKLTFEHTSVENEPEEDICDCQLKKSIPYLDTKLRIENGRVEVDLHKKKGQEPIFTPVQLPSKGNDKGNPIFTKSENSKNMYKTRMEGSKIK